MKTLNRIFPGLLTFAMVPVAWARGPEIRVSWDAQATAIPCLGGWG